MDLAEIILITTYERMYSNMNETTNVREPLSINTLTDRLHYNERHFTTKDVANKTLGMFACAALFAAKNMPAFRQNIEDMLELRHDLTPSHAVKLLERCYQAALLELDPAYPVGYENKDAWLDAFTAIESHDEAAEMLSYRLLTQRVQSNIAERYKTVKLLTYAYYDRFGGQPSHLDIGSSVLHGDIKLAYNRSKSPARIPFGEIVVHEPMTDSEIHDVEKGNRVPVPNKILTHLANLAIRSKVRFGPMMGIDITDVDDISIRQWAKSCSFYPNELLDPKRVAEYNKLDRLDAEHKRVRFSRVDFSNTGDVRRLRQDIGDERFDIITFSTVFYQVGIRERHAMLVNAAQLVSEDGIILIQDAPRGDFETPYCYSASVIDSTRPELGEQQFIRWKTPRCTEALIGHGRLSIGGKLLRFDQALAHAFANR